MLSKREFITRMGIVGASSSLMSCGNQSVSSSIAIMKPGIQLYTLREPLRKSPAETLRTIADIGYQQVELAGLPEGVSAQEFRAMLDESGLVCPAIHLQGQIQQQAEIAHVVGARMVIQAVPFSLLNENWALRQGITLDDFRRLAVELNNTGEKAQRLDLSFGYHNHAWEMTRFGNKLAYDVLLEDTDPESVFMELDLGWAHVGQVDALQLFTRFPGRFKTCHIKDFNANNEIVELGAGQVPLNAHLLKYRLAGFEHFFVEHDETPTPIETARRSYQFLRRQNYI